MLKVMHNIKIKLVNKIIYEMFELCTLQNKSIGLVTFLCHRLLKLELQA